MLIVWNVFFGAFYNNVLNISSFANVLGYLVHAFTMSRKVVVDALKSFQNVKVSCHREVLPQQQEVFGIFLYSNESGVCWYVVQSLNMDFLVFEKVTLQLYSNVKVNFMVSFND